MESMEDTPLLQLMSAKWTQIWQLISETTEILQVPAEKGDQLEDRKHKAHTL